MIGGHRRMGDAGAAPHGDPDRLRRHRDRAGRVLVDRRQFVSGLPRHSMERRLDG
jgi:hypothetical protein